jgi:hypothetical protein
MKTCNRCKETKELGEFGKHSRNKDGLRCYCRACNNAFSKTSKDMNLEKVRAANNRCTKAWAKNNPDKANAISAKRRSVKLQRIAKWANKEVIASFYLIASKRGHHVDHIIPLLGEKVSGLHVETNLMIIPGSLNSSKHNTFDESLIADLYTNYWGV